MKSENMQGEISVEIFKTQPNKTNDNTSENVGRGSEKERKVEKRQPEEKIQS